MKKYLFVFLGLLTVFALTSVVSAATTVSFSPTAVNVTAGQTFNLSVAVNPQGIKNYTIKLELKYPADLLEVKSFSFASGWMVLTQTGYDLIDNSSGTLIKTGGYPIGLASATQFGTVSFYAKKAGNGQIQTGASSLALDGQSQNVLSGTSQTLVTISAPLPTPTPPTPPTTQVETPVSPQAPVVEQPIIPSPAAPPQSLLAQVGNFFTSRTGNILIGIMAVIVILIGYTVYLRRKKLK